MKKGLFILLSLLCMQPSGGQDPQFSQFYSNYLYLAPSFSGLTDKNRLSVNYRRQWPEISNGYLTYSVSFDKFIEKFSSGIGVLIMQDIAGTGMLRTTNLGIQYSFDFGVTPKWNIRPGMHFNYTQRDIDFDKLIWNDQISAPGFTGTPPATAELVPLEHIGDIDFSASVLAYSERFWIGGGIDHLLQPNQSFYFYEEEDGNPAKVPLKFSFFGGMKFIKNENLLRPIPMTLQLAFLYRQQEEFRQLDLGVYWYRHPLVIGLWYRGIPFYKEVFNRDAFTLLAGIKGKSVSIGYSYDFTISRLVTNTGGAHEISVSYTFKTRPIKMRPRMIPCPEF
jgi:type IX secretion system PorP/SprF family membrane protein